MPSDICPACGMSYGSHDHQLFCMNKPENLREPAQAPQQSRMVGWGED